MYSDEKQKEICLLYSGEMEIIKLRIESIFSAEGKIGYLEPTVEFQALQLRKVIEQIVLSSLIANADVYKDYYNRLETEWNARYICRDLKRIHSDYFPVSAESIKKPNTIDEISNCEDKSITADELIDVYEKLGKLLHAHNPFSPKIDYKNEQNKIYDICRKIVKFLSVHTTRLYGEKAFLYVVMQATNHNGRVGINWFEQIEEPEI